MVKPKKTRTSHLNASQKFEYYFNLRMSLLKSALRGVGNLSNRNVYDVPDNAKNVNGKNGQRTTHDTNQLSDHQLKWIGTAQQNFRDLLRFFLKNGF